MIITTQVLIFTLHKSAKQLDDLWSMKMLLQFENRIVSPNM